MKESIYSRTIDNGGGTFDAVTGQSVTSGYAVATIDGTFVRVNVNDRDAFDVGIASVIQNFPAANVGTWVDGDTIHIDPVMVLDNEAQTRKCASENSPRAYYIIHEQQEVRL